MKKILINLIIFGLVILIIFIPFKISSSNYQKLVNDRIGKVIEIQEADLGNARIDMDEYDYFDSSYSKRIYFNDDPEIEYRYNYEKPRDRVHLTAFYKSASVNVIGMETKYIHSIKVYFDSEGTIIKVKKLK